MPLTVGPTFGVDNPGVQGFSDFFKQNGVNDSEAPYWASKWGELNQRGQQLNDPNYANRFLSNAEVFTGSPEATARNMWGNQQGGVLSGGNNVIQQLMQALGLNQGGAQPYNPSTGGNADPRYRFNSVADGNSGWNPTYGGDLGGPGGIYKPQGGGFLQNYNWDNALRPGETAYQREVRVAQRDGRQPMPQDQFDAQQRIPVNMQATGNTNGSLIGTTFGPSNGGAIGQPGKSPVASTPKQQPAVMDQHPSGGIFGTANTMMGKSPMGAPSFYGSKPTSTKPLPSNNLMMG